MKKQVIIIVIFIVGLVVTSLSCLYAWFTFRYQTKSITIGTEGLVLSYEIDSSEETNITSFTISDLVFFDPDEIDDDDPNDTPDNPEIDYFTSMATRIRIDITNLSSKAVTVTVNEFFGDGSSAYPFINKYQAVTDGDFDSSIIYYSYNSTTDTYQALAITSANFTTDGSLYVAVPYVKCLFTQTELTTGDSKEVEDFFPNRDELTFNLAAYSTSSTNDSSYFYVYIFGIQPNDSAINGEFIDSDFNFYIKIKALKQ